MIFFGRLTVLFLVVYGIQMFFFCLSFEIRLEFVVVEVKFGFLCDF